MRSPVTVSLAAVGLSPWIPVDPINAPFAIGFQVAPSSNFTGTATVQHTFDDLGPTAQRYISLTQSATTITVTDVGRAGTPGGGNGHGLSANDSVILTGTNALLTTAGLVGLDGVYNVTSITSQTVYVLTASAAQSQTPAFTVTGLSNALRVANNATVVTVSARTDGNYAFPIRAIRLNAVTLSAGYVDLTVNQGIAL